jgi:hypothetical protein
MPVSTKAMSGASAPASGPPSRWTRFPARPSRARCARCARRRRTMANVVTYVAVVGFSNTGGRLMPGMTANVRVITDSARERAQGAQCRAAGAHCRCGAAGGRRLGCRFRHHHRRHAPAAGRCCLRPMAQPAGRRGGGGGGAMRERLVTALKLDAEQQARLDAIGAEMRPRFAGCATCPRRSAPAAREKLLAEMQQKISAMLDAGAAQSTPYERSWRRPRPCRGWPAAAGTAATGPQVAGPCPHSGWRGRSPKRPHGPAAGSRRPVAPAPAPRPHHPPARWRRRWPGGAAQAAAVARWWSFATAWSPSCAWTPAQAAKVDALMADVRPRFMTLRDLPARGAAQGPRPHHGRPARRIGDVLTPEQKPLCRDAHRGRGPHQHARPHLPDGRGRQAARLQCAAGHHRRQQHRAAGRARRPECGRTEGGRAGDHRCAVPGSAGRARRRPARAWRSRLRTMAITMAPADSSPGPHQDLCDG